MNRTEEIREEIKKYYKTMYKNFHMTKKDCDENTDITELDELRAELKGRQEM